MMTPSLDGTGRGAGLRAHARRRLPAGTFNVTVEAGERLMGTLTFLGRINPAATELTLHTYGGYDGEPGEQNRNSSSVNMSIPIPLEQD